MTRLSDWVSAMSPTAATEIALLLFLGVFIAVAIRHGRRSAAPMHASASMLPLADDDVMSSSHTATGGGS